MSYMMGWDGLAGMGWDGMGWGINRNMMMIMAI